MNLRTSGVGRREDRPSGTSEVFASPLRVSFADALADASDASHGDRALRVSLPPQEAVEVRPKAVRVNGKRPIIATTFSRRQDSQPPAASFAAREYSVTLSKTEVQQLQRLYAEYLGNADEPESALKLLARVSPNPVSSDRLVSQFWASKLLARERGSLMGRPAETPLCYQHTPGFPPVGSPPPATIAVVQFQELIDFALHVKRDAVNNMLTAPGLMSEVDLSMMRDEGIVISGVGYSAEGQEPLWLRHVPGGVRGAGALGRPRRAPGAGDLGERQRALEAFVNLGGAPDGSGTIPVRALQDTFNEFHLAINIAEYTGKYIDHAETGEVDFEEFEWLYRRGIGTHQRRRARSGCGLAGASVISGRSSNAVSDGVFTFNDSAATGSFWIRGYGNETVHRFLGPSSDGTETLASDAVSAMGPIPMKPADRPTGVASLRRTSLIIRSSTAPVPTGRNGGDDGHALTTSCIDAAKQVPADPESGTPPQARRSASPQMSPLLLQRSPLKLCNSTQWNDSGEFEVERDSSPTALPMWHGPTSTTYQHRGAADSSASAGMRSRLEDLLSRHTARIKKLDRREQRLRSRFALSGLTGGGPRPLAASAGAPAAPLKRQNLTELLTPVKL